MSDESVIPAIKPKKYSAHILVVDDSRTNRALLSGRLDQQGYTTATADDGQQALENLNTQSFDLVLLDVMMPRLDGYEVMARMKSVESLRYVPVIMISAEDEIESVVKGNLLGAEDYLPKPFNPVLLKARIEACLEKKRLHDQDIQYLRQVKQVTAAAAGVEAGHFDPELLEEIARRPDELGRLARVFTRMAQEVRAREENLKQQLEFLTIRIDEVQESARVAEITDTDYFQKLPQEANRLRSKSSRPGPDRGQSGRIARMLPAISPHRQ